MSEKIINKEKLADLTNKAKTLAKNVGKASVKGTKELAGKIGETTKNASTAVVNTATNTVEKVKSIEVPQISQEDIMDLLDKCYDGAINGFKGSKSCVQLAEEYLEKYSDPKIAAEKFVEWQVLKCTTSGFVTGLGGLITLPVTIPANVASVIYVQMRMIGTMAVLGGHNLHDDEVQTLVYITLVKQSITDICKQTGIKVANKVSLSMLKKLPGTMLTKINQKVGFRLLTKFGQTGVINLSKMVPILGGIVGGGVDFFDTKSIAKKAYDVFLLNNLE